MILFKSRCYNGGAQHRFEPRITYERSNPTFKPEPGSVVLQNDIVAMEISVAQKQTYHGDVCVWCGKKTHTGDGNS